LDDVSDEWTIIPTIAMIVLMVVPNVGRLVSHDTAAQGFGVTQGIFGVIRGAFGAIQGTFGVIQGTFGVIQATLGVTRTSRESAR